MSSILALTEPETSSNRTTLRSVELRGPAGRLEALLNEGSPSSPFAALVCHPHPLGGGTMHNKVVYHAMKVLNAPEWGFQLPVLRFNFRGTGLSEGQHDGRAESEDVTAALEWLRQRYQLPIVVTGFSFGAAMALIAACGSGSTSRNHTLSGLAALGLPTQVFDHKFTYSFLAGCTLPKLFLSGDRDQYAPQEDLRQVADAAGDPKKLVFISDADHFFSGRLEPMQNALASWLKEHLQ